MRPNVDEKLAIGDMSTVQEQKTPAVANEGEDLRIRRWQVSFAAGPGWYPVGEFLALDAASAVGRAIEIFGAATDYRSEEIPWDAAPLHQAKRSPRSQVD